MRKHHLLPPIAGLLLQASTVNSESSGPGLEDRLQGAWREGAIATSYLLNEHLNPMTIDIDVDGPTAVLTGTVGSEISKALAAEVALSIDGIESVDNQLSVDPEQGDLNVDGTLQEARQALSDTAITAKVKGRLLANSHTSGRAISVATQDGAVTLTGSVASAEESELAYFLTRNTEGVRVIDNRLRIAD